MSNMTPTEGVLLGLVCCPRCLDWVEENEVHICQGDAMWRMRYRRGEWWHSAGKNVNWRYHRLGVGDIWCKCRNLSVAQGRLGNWPTGPGN